MFCQNCGKECADSAIMCPNCGQLFRNDLEKSWIVALLLCIFLGGFGAHRFYVGKNGSAIAQLLMSISVVLCWVTAIWVFVDLILICIGSFKTSDNLDLRK